jgi:hypothetical protein
MFAVGHVSQDQLQPSDRNTGELEPSIRVRDDAEARALDRDQRIGHRGTAICVYDDAGYDPRFLSGDRLRKRERQDEEGPADAVKERSHGEGRVMGEESSRIDQMTRGQNAIAVTYLCYAAPDQA